MAKPAYVINWPAAVDERHPDLTRHDLPLDLSQILTDLDHIRTRLRATNTDFAVSTFVWLADEGLRINASRPNERSLYWYLNGNDVLWPLRYRDIKRFSDFQNTVFREYCELNHIQLVDLARWFPRDPALFIDAIHVSYAGIKVHGWITFLQLLPLVEQRLTHQASVTPIANAPAPVTAVTTIDEIEAALAAGASPLRSPDLNEWTGATPAVRLTTKNGRLLVTGTATRWAYQAMSAPIAVEPDRYYRIKVNARVVSGAIGLGVLDEHASWISFPLDLSAVTFNSGANKAVRLVIADTTPDLRGVDQSVFEIEREN